MRIINKNSLFLLFTITLVFLFTCLGTWQLKGKYEKERFIEKIKTNINSKALIYNQVYTFSLYDKLQVSGEFDLNINNIAFLYGRKSGTKEKDGYYVIMIFKAHDKREFLVNRGWISHSDKQKYIAYIKDAKKDKEFLEVQRIEAIVMPSEKIQMFVPKNDYDRKIWFALNIQDIQGNLKKSNLCDYYLYEINNNKLPSYMRINQTNLLANIRNDHLEYAITWYMLALSLVVLYVFKKRSMI